MEIFKKIWMVDWIIRNALAGQSLLSLNEESVTVFFKGFNLQFWHQHIIYVFWSCMKWNDIEYVVNFASIIAVFV